MQHCSARWNWQLCRAAWQALPRWRPDRALSPCCAASMPLASAPFCAGRCLPDAAVHGPGAWLHLRHRWGQDAGTAPASWAVLLAPQRQDWHPCARGSQAGPARSGAASLGDVPPSPAGFLIRRLPGRSGPWQPSWSAPSYYRCHGFCIGALAGDALSLTAELTVASTSSR